MDINTWMNKNNSSNVLGYLWDEVSGRNARNEQNEFNRQQSLEAYQRDIQMWNLQNEYNSPAAQMARYQAAGLNPNLIYGQGSSGNASSSPSYHPAQSSGGFNAPSVLGGLSRVGSMLSTLIGLKTQIAQASVLEARAKNLLLEQPWITKRNNVNYWSSLARSPLAYFKLEDPDTDFLGFSPSQLAEGDPGMLFMPGFSKALQDEKLMPYYDVMKREQIIRYQQLNSLLRKQNEMYKLDKYIGFGTDILGSLLGLGKFGLDAKKFRYITNH